MKADQQRSIGEQIGHPRLDLSGGFRRQRPGERRAREQRAEKVRAHDTDIIDHPTGNDAVKGHDEEGGKNSERAERAPTAADA